jgi:hypothetical protein
MNLRPIKPEWQLVQQLPPGQFTIYFYQGKVYAVDYQAGLYVELPFMAVTLPETDK